MTSRSERNALFLDELGVGPMWMLRDKTAPTPDGARLSEGAVEAAPEPAPFASEQAFSEMPSASLASAQTDSVPATPEIHEMNWDQLKATVASCTKCGLCQNRTHTVFGVGDEKATWLFVGEGPGYNEDLRGEPFVGPAGKLLDNMLLAMDLHRGSNAYIANIVKCRPTDADGRDRPPTSEEVAACMPYLERQIALIQPTVIVALGKTAALSLLKLDPATPVSKLRGTVHRFANLPLIVTYHPAYLLRNPVDKRKAWADLCLAMNTYAGATA